MNLSALRSKRNSIGRNVRSLMDNNRGSLWTASHQAAYDRHMAEIDAVNDLITAAETAVGEFHPTNGMESFDRNLRRFVQSGWDGFDGHERLQVRNAMSTTTAAEGGYTVPSEVASRLIEALKDYSGVRRVAEVVVTAKGNALPWPTSDGTSEVGELVAENASATPSDPSFATAPMTAYRYSSKIIAAPVELLMDSSIDMEGFIADRCAQRIGRISNQHFTTGTGTGQPYGLAAAAAVGKTGTAGQTTTIIHDDVVDLIHSVNGEYRQDSRGAQFMGSDLALKMLRKLKDNQSRPLYLPSDGESAESILGYQFVVNNSVAAPAASAKSLLFGNFWRGYKVRDVLDIALFRIADSVYLGKGQVGFVAYMRSGGNLADAAAVKAYQHSAT